MYCPMCGTENVDTNAKCVQCEQPLQAYLPNAAPPAAEQTPQPAAASGYETTVVEEYVPFGRQQNPATGQTLYGQPVQNPAMPVQPAPGQLFSNQPASSAPSQLQSPQAMYPQTQYAQPPPGSYPPGGYPMPAYPPQEETAFSGMIPTKNPKALIGYYLAVFSLFPLFGLFLGIGAVAMGSQGLKAFRENPQIKGKTHAWFAMLVGGFLALCNLAVIIFVLVTIISQR